jgi:putative ABC transport system permease protein
VRLIARTIVRRRWAALVALGLVAGITGAAVTSAIALARRSGTAYDRLEAQTAPGDLTMFAPAGEVALEQALALPGVQQAWVAQAGVAAVGAGDATRYIGVLAGPPPPSGLFRPIPIEGRLPNPEAEDEVVIAESLVDEVRAELGRAVGARLPLHFLTPEEFRAFDVGFGAPDGPAIEVTVVGAARLAGAQRFFALLGSPGFAAAHPDASVGPRVQIALERGAAGVPAFLRQLERLERELAPPAGGEEFRAFEVEVESEGRTEVDTTASTLVTGLAVFAVVAGLTGMLVVGQAFARHHTLTAHEQRIEAALGLTGVQRAAARVLAASVSAGFAAAVTAGGTLLAGGGGPIGALSAYEPNPGRSVNIALIVIGSAIAAVVVLAAAGGTAWLAGRSRPAARRWWQPRWVDRLSARPAAVGVRFAIGAGAGAAARAARVGLAGLVVGIVGIVGALTFDASLTRLVDTPGRYGWSADFAIVDSRPDIDQEVLRDARVAATTRYRTSSAHVGGVPGTVDVVSAEYLQAHTGWWIVDGREPRTDEEVTVGLRLADDLGLDVGDTISVGGSRRPERDPVTVVGTGVEPPLGDHEFGSVLLMTSAGYDRFAQTEPFTQTLVRAKRPGDADVVLDDYKSKYELSFQALPPAVDNLRQLERLPALLGGFIAVVGFAMLAHAMVIAVRRRSHDLAVLRAVGYTPGQTATAVVTMALVVGLLALVVGVPIGIGAGRFLWQLVARDASVEGDALIPTLRTFATSGAVLVAALLVAALPARRAATLAPATLLRAE